MDTEQPFVNRWWLYNRVRSILNLWQENAFVIAPNFIPASVILTVITFSFHERIFLVLILWEKPYFMGPYFVGPFNL